MKVLRSRVVPTPADDTTQISKKPSEAEPATPMEHQLTSSTSPPGSVTESGTGRSLPSPPRRRSLRLLPGQISETTENSSLGKISELAIGDGSSETREIEGRETVRSLDAGPVEFVQESNTSGSKDKGKRKLSSDDSSGSYNDGGRRGFMSLRSGKSVAKRGKNDFLDASFDLDVERENDEIVFGGAVRVSVEKMHLGSPTFERVLRGEGNDDKLPETAKSLSEVGPSGSGTRSRTNYHTLETVEEGNLVRDDSCLNWIDIAATVPVVDTQNADLNGNAPIVENISGHADMRHRRTLERNELPDPVDHMGRFREIARRNASRFAHFNPEDDFGDGERIVMNVAPTEEAPSEENQAEIEDWPGPFSTAMKIIRDRTAKKGFPWNSSSTDKSKTPSIKWVPSSAGRNQRKRMPSSLMELCLKVLAANADAVTSLEGVPDAQRHKLSQLLCDSRKMNHHVFGLLIKGSPSEVRIKDCSWLTEEELDESFKDCDTSKLTVLQLDQCGRCLPDYILLSIAKSANCFPLLSTISIIGACRLTDDGLARLALSAPTLESLNLSQCSLLTFKGIETLATTSGSILKELHLDDCQCIDPMLILPALKKLEHLEVLSLAGIPLSDDFIEEFISVQGHKMKELILRDCVNLTDISFKVIGDKCSGLCSINLVNLTKLTDYSIGYLANGCQAIEKLVLCRNTFSDEAIAAFLEIAGEELKELSLNNVKKVGSNTAISLAKTAKKLEYLDASWCRNLTYEALGLIVDSCLSLKHLRVFGCTQITDMFVKNGHSNPEVEVVGLMMSAFLEQCRKNVIQLPSKYMSMEDE